MAMITRDPYGANKLLGPDEMAWLIHDWQIVHALLWNGYSCVAQIRCPDPHAYELPMWHKTNYPVHWNDLNALDGCVFESSGMTLRLLVEC